MHISMLIWCINKIIRTRYKTNKLHFLCQNIYHFFIIKVISCWNISACLFLKYFCFRIDVQTLLLSLTFALFTLRYEVVY